MFLMIDMIRLWSLLGWFVIMFCNDFDFVV